MSKAAGASLFSPTGSPNKALPPQFTSPNEKVVYELEAGKWQCLPSLGDRDAWPARQRLSSPSAFPVLPFTEQSSCHKLSGRWLGVLVLHGRIGGHSFKVNLCTQILFYFLIFRHGDRGLQRTGAAAETDEMRALSYLEQFL